MEKGELRDPKWALEVLRQRIEASSRNEEKGGSTDDDVILALNVLLNESYDFIGEKLGANACLFGMIGYRQICLNALLKQRLIVEQGD